MRDGKKVRAVMRAVEGGKRGGYRLGKGQERRLRVEEGAGGEVKS